MRVRSFIPWILVASTALGGVGIGPVLAQTAKDPSWPPPEVCKPTAKDTEDAKTLWKLGISSRDAGNYADAIKYFKDAYRRDCKALLLKHLAQAYESDGQYAAAVDTYKLYRARGKPVGEELDLLDAKIANLTKKIPAGTEGTGTATTAPTGTETAAPTGTTTATATAAPTGTATTAPTTGGGGGGPGIAPWIVVGVGGAALIGGTILWLSANSTISKKADEFSSLSCGSKPLPRDVALCNSIADDGKSAKGTRTVGVVITVVGVAAIGGGLAWAFLGGDNDKKTAQKKVWLTPGPGIAGLGLAGRF